MDILSEFIQQNDDTIFLIEATCNDTRDEGNTYWHASIILNEEPDEEDIEGEGTHITSLNLIVEPDLEGNTLHIRYTLDYEVNEVGVNDRTSLDIETPISIEAVMEWFKTHYKTYDLDDVTLPIAANFFHQTQALWGNRHPENNNKAIL